MAITDPIARFVQLHSSKLNLSSLALYCLFLGSLLSFVLPLAFRTKLFTGKYGRRHRVMGALYLLWLTVGVVYEICARSTTWQRNGSWYFMYDAVLGVLGTILTLTAASDFKTHHKRVRNKASGALDQDATITYDEMMEHSFYQGLNLLQIVTFHLMDSIASADMLYTRIALVTCLTLPWSFRSMFPVNHFSDNYKYDDNPWILTKLMYRLKKYQYVFYKHWLLHGLNLSLAISGAQVVNTPFFRLYWIALNSAYVMEFFLQTLVKRKLLPQQWMLKLNQLLMVASTLAAFQVLVVVDHTVAFVSMIINFNRRGADVTNFLLLLMIAVMKSKIQN